MPDFDQIGLVVIGRNEGERLRCCLNSAVGKFSCVIYVDSGSTDDSVSMAHDLGIEVVELDMTIPFTAARARNEGFQRLKELNAKLMYVQFVDGDCEIVSTWPGSAAKYLDENTQTAVVCGRRRERFPERSVYNMLCDVEWNTPIGLTKSCGGDAMMRISAFLEVGGYRSDLIAGEEPELCVRLRGKGWQVWRLDEEMTLHDAAIYRFGQWWKRSVRGGYAFAQGAHLHGRPPERHKVKESRSIWIWGMIVPVLIWALAGCFGPHVLLLILIYPLQVMRLAYADLYPRNFTVGRWQRACFLVIGKFPELVGQLKFLFHRLLKINGRLIEYK